MNKFWFDTASLVCPCKTFKFDVTLLITEEETDSGNAWEWITGNFHFGVDYGWSGELTLFDDECDGRNHLIEFYFAKVKKYNYYFLKKCPS